MFRLLSGQQSFASRLFAFGCFCHRSLCALMRLSLCAATRRPAVSTHSIRPDAVVALSWCVVQYALCVRRSLCGFAFAVAFGLLSVVPTFGSVYAPTTSLHPLHTAHTATQTTYTTHTSTPLAPYSTRRAPHTHCTYHTLTIPDTTPPTPRTPHTHHIHTTPHSFITHHIHTQSSPPISPPQTRSCSRKFEMAHKVSNAH